MSCAEDGGGKGCQGVLLGCVEETVGGEGDTELPVIVCERRPESEWNPLGSAGIAALPCTACSDLELPSVAQELPAVAQARLATHVAAI